MADLSVVGEVSSDWNFHPASNAFATDVLPVSSGDDLGATINAYLAMRAAFAAILDHNEGGDRRIESVAVPGLGTGVGGMSPEDSALQMRAAYDMIVAGGWKDVLHPAQAPFVMRDRGKRR